MTPFELGRRDAEHGLLCVYEMYYRTIAQAVAYTLGYLSVNPENWLAQMTIQQLRRQAA